MVENKYLRLSVYYVFKSFPYMKHINGKIQAIYVDGEKARKKKTKILHSDPCFLTEE